MRKVFIITGLSFISVFSFSQNEWVDTATISKITNEEADHSQIMYLASHITDHTGPRLTWSPGFDRAADWVMSEFKKWGLQNIHKEFWDPKGKVWSIQKCYAAISQPYYQNIAATPQAWSAGTNGPATAEVMLVSAKDSAEFVEKYAGKIKGKIILIEPSDPSTNIYFGKNAERFTEDSLQKLSKETDPGNQTLFSSDTAAMRKKIDNLLKIFSTYFINQRIWTFCKMEGAVAVLNYGNDYEGTYKGDGSYNYLSKPGQLAEASINIRKEDYLRMYRLLKDNVTVKMDLDVQTTIGAAVQGYNIVADIPGTDPQLKNELVMVGGHFDSWHGATGATDNGAGSITMMEVLRILKSMNLPMKRTVRIVLWGGEEQGLLGSLAYVNKNVAEFSTMKPLRDYELISAYYNLDNGSGQIRGINLQNNPQLRNLFETWLAPFKKMDGSTVSIKNSGYTDNECFDIVGIPAFQFIQDPLNYETRAHHTNADNYEQLSEKDLKQASTIIASLVYLTANRKEKLPRKEKPKPYGNFNFYILN